MYLHLRLKKRMLAGISLTLAVVSFLICGRWYAMAQTSHDYIKWVDFGPTYEAMYAAMKLDIASQETDTPLNWIELLSYLALKNGGDFRSFRSSQLTEVVSRLKKGVTMEELVEDGKQYYDYYLEAYTAVLGGFLGEYQIQVSDSSAPAGITWETRYGLKAFSPIAKGYGYSHYDDFGNSRSYGFRRKHLGNDVLGAIGTPIVAVEGGTVEALGWNQYGGWRIGIRSFDRKRYYYYAHLRKDFPYHKTLQEGSVVAAGDVIGYMGRTGYSAKENVNNITQNHLHFGIQLIFDESQKEGNNEIWIDCYQIVRLLSHNRSAVQKDSATKDYYRTGHIRDLSLPIQPTEQALPPQTTQPDITAESFASPKKESATSPN